jgi:hypothetical protein
MHFTHCTHLEYSSVCYWMLKMHGDFMNSVYVCACVCACARAHTCMRCTQFCSYRKNVSVLRCSELKVILNYDKTPRIQLTHDISTYSVSRLHVSARPSSHYHALIQHRNRKLRNWYSVRRILLFVWNVWQMYKHIQTYTYVILVLYIECLLKRTNETGH